MFHFPFNSITLNLVTTQTHPPTALIPVFLSRNIFLRSVDWHRSRNHMKVTLQEVISFNKHNYSTRNLTTNYLSIGFFFVSPFECHVGNVFQMMEEKNRTQPALTIVFIVMEGFITLHRGLIEDFMGIDRCTSSKGNQAMGLWCWQSGMEESFTDNLVQTCILYC